MEWYTTVLKKYAVFSGRARRKEFWFFTLFAVIISIILSTIDSIAGLTVGPNEGVLSTISGQTVGVLSTIYAFAVLIPTIAVGVRRMHDINRRGWWVLVSLIPFVGLIIFIVLAAQEGTIGPNRYGEDPKAAEHGAEYLHG